MLTLVCREYGPLDNLRFEDVPPTPCRDHEARVTISAAGVNFVDGLTLQGLYQIKPPLPFYPGSEASGVVSEIGSAVTNVKVGDRVITMAPGCFAQEVVVAAARLIATPPQLTDGQAATFFQSYATAWFALHQRANVRAGQSVLVLGAGSGVGLAAVDVATAAGLTVIAAASSDEKCQAAAAAGAIATVNTTTGNVKEEAKAFSAGGVDYVYDPVGGELAEQGLRSLRDDGQFIVIGFAAGAIPMLPANQILLRNRRVTGVDFGGWISKHPEDLTVTMAGIMDGIASGALNPVEPIAYPMTEAVQALKDLRDRKIVGKLALMNNAAHQM